MPAPAPGFSVRPDTLQAIYLPLARKAMVCAAKFGGSRLP